MTNLASIIVGLDEEQFDPELEPHILTTHEQVKTVPCRDCRRPCVVTTFAAPAKTSCNDCRHPKRDHATVAQTDVTKLDPAVFDLSLDPHHVTKADRAQWLPCTACRRPCLVSAFAAKTKVRCFKHGRNRKKAPDVALQRPRLDPFERLITEDERTARLIGRTLTLRIQVDRISFTDTLLVERVRDYDPDTGLLRFYALQGGQRAVYHDDIVGIV